MIHQRVNMSEMPLRRGHFRVLAVASMGQVTGAGLSTLVGVIIPMIQMLNHPELSPFVQGIIGCTSLIGITIGSMLFGRLSDKYGYLFFFRFCPFLVFLASLFIYFITGIGGLIAGLFLMGLGIGGEYSLDSDYISEIMPVRWQLFMVGVAKASSALGNISVALICFLLLRGWQNPEVWNRLLLIIAFLTLLTLFLRIRFVQSPGWLISHGRSSEAEEAVQYFLGKDVDVIESATSDDAEVHHYIGADREVGEIRNRSRKAGTNQASLTDLFRGENLKRVIFSGIPWACEGFGIYGIGVFLPVLLIALGLDISGNGGDNDFQRIIHSVETTTLINCFILIGFVLGLCIVNRLQHVKIQVWGFVLGAVGLVVLWVAYRFRLPVFLAIGGFMIFELFLNAGPHLMTFIIPSQIYPVADRGEGAGLAAAIGKAGAVLGVLFIPMLLKRGGVELVLIVTIVVLLVGAWITARLGHKVLPENRS